MPESALSLVERLRAALDRAEEIAHAADRGPWEVGPSFGARNNRVYVRQEGDLIDSIGTCVIAGQVSNMPQFRQNAIFIAANSPDVVLRTVAAHRRILERHAPRETGPAAAVCTACIATWHYEIDNEPWPCADVRDLAAVYFPEAPDGT